MNLKVYFIFDANTLYEMKALTVSVALSLSALYVKNINTLASYYRDCRLDKNLLSDRILNSWKSAGYQIATGNLPR